MTPEEKYRNRRIGSYVMTAAGALVFVAGCFFVRSIIIIVAGLLILLGGLIYNSSVNRKYREEVNSLTDDAKMDFSVFDKKGGEAEQGSFDSAPNSREDA